MVSDSQMELYKTIVAAIDQQSDTAKKMLAVMVATSEKITALEARVFELECQLQLVGLSDREKH